LDTFLGLVQNSRFTVLVPEAALCCSVRLTRLERPAIPETDAVIKHELDLSQYEGRAIMVCGALPEYKGWLYEAQIIDEASPILTAVVNKIFAKK
jgi:hypothetical protein